jgi:hypothetical protein
MLGTRVDALVGVCLGRTADLLPALVGVWQAGAAYLPLDPSCPPNGTAHLTGEMWAAVCTGGGSLPRKTFDHEIGHFRSRPLPHGLSTRARTATEGSWIAPGGLISVVMFKAVSQSPDDLRKLLPEPVANSDELR